MRNAIFYPILCLLSCLLLPFVGKATVYTSVVTNAPFHLTSTWEDADGNAPSVISAADTFQIQAGHTITVDGNRDLQVALLESNGRLVVQGVFEAINGITINASGDIQVNGRLNVPSLLTLNGSGTFSAGTVAYTSNSPQTVLAEAYSTLILQGGTKNAATGTIRVESLENNSQLFNLGAESLEVLGVFQGQNVDVSQGSVAYIGGQQEILAVAYGELLLSGGEKTLRGNTSVAGLFTLQVLLELSGNILELGGELAISVNPQWEDDTIIYNGTENQNVFPGGYGTLILAGEGDKVINGDLAVINPIEVRESADFRLFAGVVKAAGLELQPEANLTIQGDSLLLENNLELQGFCRLQGGVVQIGGNLILDDTGVLQGIGESRIGLQGDIVNEGNFSHTGNFVFEGTANQTINEGACSFDTLTIDKRPNTTLALASDIIDIVANATRIEQGIFSMSDFTGSDLGTVSGREGGVLNIWGPNNQSLVWPLGNYSNLGNSGVQIWLTRNQSYTIPPLPDEAAFPSIRVFGTGTKSLLDSINIQGSVTIEGNATLDNAGFPIYLNGSWTEVNANAALKGEGKVVFYGAGEAQVSGLGIVRFQDLEVRDAGKVVTVESPIVLEGDLLVTNSATLIQMGDVNWSGKRWDVRNQARFLAEKIVRASGTEMVFSGDSQLQFFDLQFEEGASATLEQSIRIGNDLVLLENSRLEAQSFGIVGGNRISMSEDSQLLLGGFDNGPKGFELSVQTAGTIIYNREGAQRIAGLGNINQYHILKIQGTEDKSPIANINAFRMELEGGSWQNGTQGLIVEESLNQSSEATFTATGGQQRIGQIWKQLGDASLQQNILEVDSLWQIGLNTSTTLENTSITVQRGLSNKGRIEATNALLSIAEGDWQNEGVAKWPSGSVNINGNLINTDSIYASDRSSQWSISGDLDNSGTFLTTNTRFVIKGNWLNAGWFQGDGSNIDLQGNWTNRAGGTFLPGTSLVRLTGGANSLITDVDRNPDKASFYRLQISKDSMQTQVALAAGTILRSDLTHWTVGTLNLGSTHTAAIAENHQLGRATALGTANDQVILRLQAGNNQVAQWPEGDFLSSANGHSGFLATQASAVVYGGNGNYFLPIEAPCYRRLFVVEGRAASIGKQLNADVCVQEELVIGEQPNGTEASAKANFKLYTVTLQGDGLRVTNSSFLSIENEGKIDIQQGNGRLTSGGEVNIGRAGLFNSTGSLVIQQGNWEQESGRLRLHGQATMTVERGDVLGQGNVELSNTSKLDLIQGGFLRAGRTIQVDESIIELQKGDLQEKEFLASDEGSVIFSNIDQAQNILESDIYQFANLRLRKQGQALRLNSKITIEKGLWLNSYQKDGTTFNTQGGQLQMQQSDIALGQEAIIYGKNGVASGEVNGRAAFDKTQMLAMDGTPFTGRLIIEVIEEDVATSLERIFPIGSGTAKNAADWQYNPVSYAGIIAGTEENPSLSLAVIPYASGQADILDKYWEVRSSGILPISQAQVLFQYTDAEIDRQGGELEVRRYDLGEAFVVKDAVIQEENRIFGASTENTFLEGDWRLGVLNQLPNTYYSYQSGNWSDPQTWTQDPTGLTQSAIDIAPLKARGGGPDLGDYVVLLNGHTISIQPTTNGLALGSVTLEQGVLRIEEGSERHYFGVISGTGTLLNVVNSQLPLGNYTSFASENGGTLALETPEGKTTVLEAAQTDGRLHNLEIRGEGITTLAEGYEISGDLTVSKGNLVIEGNQAVQGNVSIEEGAVLRARGSQVLRAFQDVNIQGVFLGNDKDTIDYGMGNNRLAMVLDGEADASVIVAGTAFFDQFRVDKASTAVVTLNATNADSLVFNNALAEVGEGNKALTLTSGMLRLPSSINIRSLTEGGSPFVIGEEATLWIDGATVRTSPYIDTLDANYGFNIKGRLLITRGLVEASAGPGIYFSDNSNSINAGGIGGQIEVQGGVLNAKSIFTEYNQTGSLDGFGAFIQSDGEVNLTGTGVPADRLLPAATFSLPSTSSIVELNGGTLSIKGNSNGWLANIRASNNNREVVGGNINVAGKGSWYLEEVYNLNIEEGSSLAVRSIQQIRGNTVLQTGSLLSTTQDLTFEGNWRQQGDYRTTATTILGGVLPQVVTGMDSTQNLIIENTDSPISWQSTTQVFGDLSIAASRVALQGNITVSGDLALEGEVLGVGTVVLQNESDPQFMTSTTGHAVIDRLTLSNPLGVSMQGGFQINRAIRLASGILSTGRNTLTLGNAIVVDDAGLGFGEQRMIAVQDGGVEQLFNRSESYLLPVGTEGVYAPLELSVNTTGDAVGSISVEPSAEVPPSTNESIAYHWQVRRSGLEGIPVSIRAFYPQKLLPDATEYQAGILTDRWQVGEPNSLNAEVRTLNYPNVTASEAWLSALKAAPEELFILYSRQSGNWDEPSTWSSVGHEGPADGRVPTQGTRVLIGLDHQVDVTQNNKRAGFLQIASNATLNLNETTGHRLGVYQELIEQEEGTLRISASTNQAVFPEGNWDDFLGEDGGTVIYADPSNAPNTFFRMPEDITSYHHLILSFIEEGDDHRIWLPENSLSISGDMTLQDSREVIFNFNGGEVRQYGDIEVEGNVTLQGGAEWRMQANDAHQLTVRGNWSQDGSWTVLAAEDGQVHDIFLYGDLLNNGLLQAQTGIRFHWKGAGDAQVIGAPFGTSGSEETTFRQLIIDKENAGSVTFNDPKLQLLPLTWRNGASTHAVALENGFAHFLQLNQPSLLISSSAVTYSIPENGGLSLINVSGSIAVADVELRGSLQLAQQELTIGGSLRYGGAQPSIQNINSDLAIGKAFIQLNGERQGGIQYQQEGGSLTIGAGLLDPIVTPVWEVTGLASQWEMTGGSLSILHSNQSNNMASLAFTPEQSAFTGNEQIEVGFGNANPETFILESNSVLPSLYIGDRNEVASRQELTLLNTVSIGEDATLSLQRHTLSLGGDFINAGVYSFNQNATRLTGDGLQQLRGNLEFYKLEKLGAGTVITSNDGLARSDVLLEAGIWDDGGSIFTIRGNLQNNAQQKSPNSLGGIRILGERTQAISGEGSLSNIIIDNAANVELLAEHRIEGVLNLRNGNLLLGAFELTFGEEASIEGGNEQHMIVTNGRSTDAGVVKEFAANQAAQFTWPIGDGNNFTPFMLQSEAVPQEAGRVSVVHVARRHPASNANFLSLSQYWRVRGTGLDGATFQQQYTYGIEQIPQGLTNENTFAARLFDAIWTTGTEAVGKVDTNRNIFTVQPNGQAANYLDGDYTIGELNAFQEVPAYRTRASGNWTAVNNWERRLNNGTWVSAGNIPVTGSIVTIRNSHQITVPNSYIVQLTQLKVEDGGLLDLQASTGHDVTEMQGQGLLRLSTTRLPAGNLTDFTGREGGTVAYDGDGILPSQQKSYKELILNASLEATLSQVRIYEKLEITERARIQSQADWLLEGDMSNEGVFNATAGKVTYGSDRPTQKLTGGGITAFYELEARSNAGTLEVSGTVAVAQELNIEKDTLILNASTLTLNGSLIGEGKFSGNDQAVLKIGGVGRTGGVLNFLPKQAMLKQLKLNRADGQIGLAGELLVKDSLILESGELQLQDAVLTLDGPSKMANGYFTANCQSIIQLTDTQGQFSNDTTRLYFNPTADAQLGTLEIKRAGEISLGGQLEICDLLSLGRGNLLLSSKATDFLRLKGDFRTIEGQWIGNEQANIYLENPASQQDALVFASSEVAKLRDFSIDRGGIGTATTFSYQIANGADSLQVYGELAIGTGSELDIRGARTLRLFGIVTGEGELLGSEETNLELGGTGNTQGIVKFATRARDLKALRISRNGIEANVQLGTDITIHERLILDSGWLALSNNTLTLLGQHERNKGALAGSAASGLIIRTPSSLTDTLVFTPWNSGQRLQALSLEQQGMTVLGSALQITGLLSLQQGVLQLPDNEEQVFTLSGQHMREEGVLRGTSQTAFSVQGNGSAGEPLVWEEEYSIVKSFSINRSGTGMVSLGTDLSIGENERLEGELSLLEGTVNLNGNTLQLYSQANKLERFELGYIGADEKATLRLYGTGDLGGELAFAPQSDTLGNLQVLRERGSMKLGSGLRVANDFQLENESYILALNGHQLHINGTPRSTTTVGLLQGLDSCATESSVLWVGKGDFGYETRPLDSLRFVSSSFFSQIKIDNDHPIQQVAYVEDGVDINICDTLNIVQGQLDLGGSRQAPSTWWIGGDQNSNGLPEMDEGQQAYVFTSPTANLLGGRYTRMVINNGGKGIGDLGAPLHFATDADTLQELWIQRRLGQNQLGQVRLGSRLHIGDSATYNGKLSMMGGELVLNEQPLILNLAERGFQSIPYDPSSAGLSLLRGDATASLVLRSNRSINTPETPMIFRWYAGNDTTLNDLNNIEGLREGLSLGSLTVELLNNSEVPATAYMGSNLFVKDIALLGGVLALPNYLTHANGDRFAVSGAISRPDPEPNLVADAVQGGGYFQGGENTRLWISGNGEQSASLFFDDRSTAAEGAALLKELIVTRTGAAVSLRTALEVAGGQFLLGDEVVLQLFANAADSIAPKFFTLGVPLSDAPGFRGKLSGNYRSDLRLYGNIPYNRLRFVDNQDRLRSLVLEGGSDRAVLQLANTLTIGAPSGSEDPSVGQKAANGRLALLNRGGLELNGQELFLNIDSMQFQQSGTGRIYADIASRIRITGVGKMGDALMFDNEANFLDEFTISRTDTGQVLLGSSLNIGNTSSSEGKLELDRGALGLNNFTLTVYTPFIRNQGVLQGGERAKLSLQGRGEVDPIAFAQDSLALYTLQELDINRAVDLGGSPVVVGLGSRLRLGRQGVEDIGGLLLSANTAFAFNEHELQLQGDLKSEGVLQGHPQGRLSLIGEEGNLSSSLNFQEGSRELDWLKLDRTGAFRLETPLTLRGKAAEDTSLWLSRGVLLASEDTPLGLDALARVVGGTAFNSGATTESYVQGYVSKEIDARTLLPFRLPLGRNGELGDLGISAVNRQPSTTTATYFDTPHPRSAQSEGNIFLLSTRNQYYLNRVSTDGWWQVRRGAADDSIRLLLPWQSGAPSDVISQMVVATLTNPGPKWQSLGQQNTQGDLNQGAVSGQRLLTEDAAVAVGARDIKPDNELPEYDLRFSATYEEGTGIRLSWTTQGELESRGFILRKAIEDPNGLSVLADYNTDASLKGQGTTLGAANYEYVDEEINLQAGAVHYYQLIQEHEDDRVTTYAIVSVNLDAALELATPYPNPTREQVTLKFSLAREGNVDLEIIGVSGQLRIPIENARLPRGTHQYTYNTKVLPAGIYIVRLRFDNQVRVTRMVVE